MRSGQLARLTGASTDTLRHYERLRLLPLPQRTAGNYRAYPPTSQQRVELIRRALAIGFSLAELKTMPSHHSDQSNHQSPDTPDCSQHQHPGLFVTKSGDVSQIQLIVLNHLTAAATTFSVAQSLPAIVSYSDDSEHALPLVSSVPLYQQISVLRI